MRLIVNAAILLPVLLLTACVSKGSNPDDPYESLNRNIYKFNTAFDATMLKPPARLYKAVLPDPVRAGINNAYNNINMIPTVGNDLLQAQWRYAVKDTWRFIINSTFGLAGFVDVADKRFGLPPHSNDLGLTFAKWGDKKSPYLVIPLLGPSTFRDGMGMLFEYTIMTPYPYLRNDAVIYGLIGLRYVDLRAQFFDTERLMNEALDPYAFIRDAYLQNRNYRINGENDLGSLYVEEDASSASDYVEEDDSANALLSSETKPGRQ
ncbi:MlaA family lipoprotein [Legionella spiritensis]|uniref:Lipoprotein VacJ-like protein n=1 Tax=Legionella spiritensis TaxID=452 RepID=A0A0W0YXN0_LEGSP|nr:VacJ family lipoprotein [Legionella spiritensis]KTD61270.1 lipoprotein VacJ-like protein [Legionella spiritensis]SNV33254.1 lipoprotein VacJ-like protein [Legionella spiritensis]